MDLTSDYFEIFGLPDAYEVDTQMLAERYRELQKQFHPDRYASKSAVQQKLAVQYTALINQAYAILRSPVERAQYLLSRKGLENNGENSTVNDSEFLLTQMTLREALLEIRDAADPFDELEKFAAPVKLEYGKLQRSFADQYSRERLEEAVETVAKMQFYRKLQQEIEQLEEELD